MQTVRDAAPRVGDSGEEAVGERSYYSISQAAALLGVSRVSIWRWIRAGQLPVIRLGHRTVRIAHADLEQLLVRSGSAGSGPGVGGASAAAAPAGNRTARDGAARLDWAKATVGEHLVQFYESDAFLVDVVGEYVGAALRAGDSAIVVATEAHREALEQRWRADGLDLAAARAGDRYCSLDAAETLSRLLVDGMPEPGRFAAVIGDAVARATDGGRGARIFGEMVALLIQDGNPAAALRLEGLWNDLQQAYTFSLMCAYPIDTFAGEPLAELLDEVCAEHSRVTPAESYAALSSPGDQLRAVAELQRKARWLEIEIAERHRAEDRLQAALAAERRHQQELADHVETAPLPMHWVGPDGTILWANRAEMDLLGYRAEEYIGQHIARFHADQAAIDNILTRLSEGENLRDYPARLRCKDGSIRHVLIDTSVLWEEGRFVHTRCFARDITELELLAETRGRLGAIVESADDAIIGKTLDGIITSWNPGAERLYGYTAAEIVGQPISRLMPPDKPDELPGILDRLRRGQRVDHFETVRVRKDGQRLDVSVSVSPIRDSRGTIVAASAIARDITERKRQEQALREERETLETLNRLGRAIAAELDLARLVQAVTDAATDLSGAQLGLFLANAVDDRGDAYQLCATSGALRETFAQLPTPGKPDLFDSTFRGEGVVRLDDLRQAPRYGRDTCFRGMLPGHLPLASYLAVPVVSRSGEVLGGLFFGHPEPGVFTERAERLVVGLAAMGAVAMDNARLYGQVQEAVRTRDEFLAAAAHDLKTPLTSIKGIAQLLRRRLARGGVATTERLLDGLAGVDVTATKMGAQIDELLDLTRLQMGQPLELRRDPTDLVELARRSVAEQQQTSERHRIRLETSLAELRGRWDPARLARVVENLLSNAIKYSPDAGDVVVTVTREQQAGAAWAVVAVRDQGLGIPAVDLPRIFERFHRAGNVVGRIAGTGIGLASVRQIVEQHGGTIAVESREGGGSTFTVRLPLERVGDDRGAPPRDGAERDGERSSGEGDAAAKTRPAAGGAAVGTSTA